MFNPFNLKKENSEVRNNQQRLNEERKNNGVEEKKNQERKNNGVEERKNEEEGINSKVIKKQNLVVNINKIRGNFSDKHHYFIGSIINRNDVKPLLDIQRNIKNNEFNNMRWSVPLHTRYIYLGYIDSSVAAEMMNKIFHPLCLAIAEKFNKLHCDYENIKYRSKQPKDSGVKIISAEYKDKQNILNNIIIPYLKKEGLKKIYDVESKVEKPHIDLLYLNCADIIYRQIGLETSKKIKLPSKGFDIDHICLIKGTPYIKKFGIPSKYDRLNIETVKEFYYPLHGEN
jgi:hypothetical protein